MNKHQTSVAAEAFAAGVFAHAGLSVFVQYGANQPGYDLVVSDDVKTLHISVKGSTNGWWPLAIKDKDGTYQAAFDEWVQRNANHVFCLVQFLDVQPGKMPRMYLATAKEIESELRTHDFGELNLALAEHYAPKQGKNKGKVMGIPAEWLMTEKRIREVMEGEG